VTDGAFVLFGDLGPRDEDGVGPPARHCGRGRRACNGIGSRPVSDVEHRSVTWGGARVEMGCLRACTGPVVRRRGTPQNASLVAPRRWDRGSGRCRGPRLLQRG
jgi:hypothetical protein